MPKSSSSDWTRGKILRAAIRIGALVIPLSVAWGHDGPPASRAFWLIMVYFIEIAIWIAVELIDKALKKSKSEK
jgi:hypothetical protein